jgi:zinc transport system substrate-binding protein
MERARACRWRPGGCRRGPSLSGLLRLILPLASLPALLLACAVPSPKESGTSTSRAQPLEVVATFLPITILTRAVTGDCARVTTLVPANLGPHDFQARPGDLLALRRARVLVKNGLGIEGFLNGLLAAANPPNLKVIDSSGAVATLQGHQHPDHAHGSANPHIWLDPLRAAQQVEAIRDGLIQVDPRCAEGYRQRAAVATARLRQLNREFADQLRPFEGKTFVAFHDVAPYFAQRYRLKAIFLVDVPEMNPSPADLQRVADQVRRSDLRVLLSEPQQGERSFHALARDLGVPISLFDPMETGSAESAADLDTYARVMRSNVAHLLQAFGGR